MHSRANILSWRKTFGSEPRRRQQYPKRRSEEPMTEYAELAARALALADAATPGPWLSVEWRPYKGKQIAKGGGESCESLHYIDHVVPEPAEELPLCVSNSTFKKGDAALIAASRTLIPDLANALLTVLKERDVFELALREAVNDAVFHMTQGGRGTFPTHTIDYGEYVRKAKVEQQAT
jgi:hypothetical protein